MQVKLCEFSDFLRQFSQFSSYRSDIRKRADLHCTEPQKLDIKNLTFGIQYTYDPALLC